MAARRRGRDHTRVQGQTFPFTKPVSLPNLVETLHPPTYFSLDFDVRVADGVPDVRDALSIRAFQSSPRFGRTQAYTFVLINCTNRLFDILDESLFHVNDFDRFAFASATRVALGMNLPETFHALNIAMNASAEELPQSLSRFNGDQTEVRLPDSYRTISPWDGPPSFRS